MTQCKLWFGAAAGAALLIGTMSALAHVPNLSDGSAVDPNSAIELGDVQVSRAFYHEFTADAPQFWVTFTVAERQTLLMNFTVPRIARLEGYRPAFALIGPGLPDPPNDLPFDVPDGAGVWVHRFEDVTDPEVFHEPFSNVYAWELYSDFMLLPEAGRYYIAAYHPTGQPGKIQMGLAEAEVWSDEELAALPETVAQIRDFFELPPGAEPPCLLIGLGMISLSLVGLIRGRRHVSHQIARARRS